MTVEHIPARKEATGAAVMARLRENVSRIIKGKDEAVELCAIALVAGGHVLLDDIPGVGKTTLARALARSLDATFHRIQFTADLLPSDVIGVSVWNDRERGFEFRPGPIFEQIVLADEINRASPKTQSALLEAMSEGQVSVDGVTHRLPELFLVIATQNPHEHAGTFPLPDSQLDRFLLSFEMGYPGAEAEREILTNGRGRGWVETLEAVVSAREVTELQRRSEDVRVDPSLIDYIQRLAHWTRTHERLSLGVSPRGALALRRAGQAKALLEGRDYTIPDDFKALITPVFAHRLQLKDRFAGLGAARTAAKAVCAQMAGEVSVPA